MEEAQQTHSRLEERAVLERNLRDSLGLPGIGSVIIRIERQKKQDGLSERIQCALSGFDIVAQREIVDTPPGLIAGAGDVIFAINCKAVEKCRDELKKVCFELHLNKPAYVPFTLGDYVDFFPPMSKPSNSIIEHTFVHGIGRFYRYLFSEQKFPFPIKCALDFLKNLPKDCPNHIFLSGPKASKGNWAFPVETNNLVECDLIQLAQSAKKSSLMQRAHENIEKFLILQDPKTFACEVPVWFEPADFSDYSQRFSTNLCITGHIDILRVESDGKIGVWDYKPKAFKEKTAHQQVWLYMNMVSKRMGIPLAEIRGGYFDEDLAFQVVPLAIK